MGVDALANATDATAFGATAQATATNATAFGAGAQAGVANSVALGANSISGVAHVGAYTITGGTVAATASAGGTVSVGAAGAERQIQNVAAGVLTATSTDAVNGSRFMRRRRRRIQPRQAPPMVLAAARRGTRRQVRGQGRPIMFRATVTIMSAMLSAR
jgi:hypothetical protein